MTYLIIFLLIIFGVFNYDILKRKVGKSFYLIFIMILLIIMSGLRYRVGGDSINYEEYFVYYPKLDGFLDYYSNDNYFGFQPLWLLLNSIVIQFGGDVYAFQFLHATIFNIVLFSYIKRESKYPFTFLFLLASSLLYFYYSFEIQRETLSVCFFLINIKNLENKRWIRYYLLGIVSFLFHTSALIIFLFPLFQLVNISNNKIIIFSIIAFPLIFLKESLFLMVKPLLFLDTMVDKADLYSEINFSLTGLVFFYSVRVLITVPYLIILNKKIGNRQNGFILAFLVISIFSQIFVASERFLNYLHLWFLIKFVDFLYSNYSIETKTNFLAKWSYFLLLFFILVYKGFLPSDKGSYYSIFFPYETILDKRMDRDREVYLQKLWDI